MRMGMMGSTMNGVYLIWSKPGLQGLSVIFDKNEVHQTSVCKINYLLIFQFSDSYLLSAHFLSSERKTRKKCLLFKKGTKCYYSPIVKGKAVCKARQSIFLCPWRVHHHHPCIILISCCQQQSECSLIYCSSDILFIGFALFSWYTYSVLHCNFTKLSNNNSRLHSKHVLWWVTFFITSFLVSWAIFTGWSGVLLIGSIPEQNKAFLNPTAIQ
jgi:hypothetical protein